MSCFKVSKNINTEPIKLHCQMFYELLYLRHTIHSLLSVFGKVGNEKVGNGSGSPKKVGNEIERAGMGIQI